MNLPANQLRFSLEQYNNSSSLIYGIGNIGRQDDGLGWAFVDWLEQEKLCDNAELMRHYQLHLEDADLISHKKKILFVDATKSHDVESFAIEKLSPKMDFSFTSHAISIPSIMATCQQCFDCLPEVYLLTIKGYEWELQQGLTQHAQQNLTAVTEYLKREI
ncbi:MAG: hydrogenase maturation protease [Methylococcales bacterium]